MSNVFEYFQGRKGNQLVIDEGKEVTLVTVRKSDILSEEMIMSFKYRNNEITVYVSKPQAELRLQFDKKITGLQRETFTSVDNLDSTLLTYLGKFVEEMEGLRISVLGGLQSMGELNEDAKNMLAYLKSSEITCWYHKNWYIT